MREIKLSYVLTTFNKLLYLKEVMRLLLQNVQADEEIVVADGGSTDGTKEYLQALYNDGLIHQFISEKDKGEAHGYNKTLLLAKGQLIKLISDDDVFYYPGIRACRKFMEENEEIDLMTGMAAMVYSGTISPIEPIEEFFEEYKKWQTGKYDRFYSNGLAMMIRKSSLPLLGLFSNEFIYVDIEYALRATKFANVAFCNQCIAVRVTNPQSKGIVFTNGKEEMYKLCKLYNYPVPATWQPEIKEVLPFMLSTRIKLSKIKKKLQGLPPFEPSKKSEDRLKSMSTNDLVQFYDYYEKEITVFNKKTELTIYTKNN